MRYPGLKHIFFIGLFLPILTHCHSGDGEPAITESTYESGPFEVIGFVDNSILDEISGMETAADGSFFVHNDEGDPVVHVVDPTGRYRAEIRLDDAKNRDWEDITIIPGEEHRWVVGGDIGDNQARYKTIRLYFFHEPLPDEDGTFPDEVNVLHRTKLRYPDGPRDCESMAYDPASDQILFMTKRDKPPRLYGIPLETALNEKSAELQFLGEVPTFTPPTTEEKLRGGKKAKWLSQPTGMDISEDGLLAAVITYRSLYLFSREPEESWIEAFNRKPREFPGPPGIYEEAVTIDDDTVNVHVTTEKIPTPIHRLPIPQ